MKTVTTVLNNRDGADRYWPQPGFLARGDEHPDSCQTRHCCLGCFGLAIGVSPESMMDRAYPSPKPGQAKFRRLWDVNIPFEVLEEITEKLDEDDRTMIRGLHDNIGEISAMNLAATLNDEIASEATSRSELEAAVDALRILFRYVGEQHGERWIIRFLTD